MLVLSRKRGESIRIGNQIILSIIDKSDGSVRIGIQAPPEIPIYREELYQKIVKENQQAVAAAANPAQLIEKHITSRK
jgi:carbon storage regulator